jgi:Xaa-Pro aminopeptidase
MARLLSIDYGKKRTGIAVSDPLQIIANGLTTVETSKLFEFLEEYLKKEEVECIVVGLPKQMNNEPSENMRRVEPFVNRLRKQYPNIPVEYYDERFSSKLAHQAMIQGGLKKRDRQNKELVDEISEEIAEEYKEQGIIISDYNNVFEYVANLPADSKVCVTGNKINWKLLQTIPESCKIVDVPSPVDLMKSIKNETELEGFRNAMIKDGVALVKFYMWLEKAIPTGEVTEVMIEEKLLEYRSQQENFVGESFGTIAGYAGNGAIVHYHATPENCLTIKPEGLLLIDSGGQYKDGTTDITRTVAAGKLTKQMKADYTNVLKGHIALATAIFPEGTRGSQLDVLARKALWNNCLTYWHGTGHGIGHFLNVHEGPQNIRLEENPTLLKPGMVTSNEPGVYRANQYGIRIENLIVTQEYRKTEEFGTFYNFETITLCPIDTRPISKKLLTKCEKKWLNKYHKMVYKKLKNHLSVEEKTWLKNKTKPI